MNGTSDGSNAAPPIDPMELARLFHRTSRLMARAFHRHDHASHAQEHVLAILRDQGPMIQADLLALLDIRSSSLSELLGKLERSGLIERERNPDDRRGFVVRATGGGSKGGGKQGAAMGAAGAFDCLDGEEKAQLHAILAKLAASMQDESTGRGGGGNCRGHGRRGGRGGSKGGGGHGGVRGGGRGNRGGGRAEGGPGRGRGRGGR